MISNEDLHSILAEKCVWFGMYRRTPAKIIVNDQSYRLILLPEGEKIRVMKRWKASCFTPRLTQNLLRALKKVWRD